MFKTVGCSPEYNYGMTGYSHNIEMDVIKYRHTDILTCLTSTTDYFGFLYLGT